MISITLEYGIGFIIFSLLTSYFRGVTKYMVESFYTSVFKYIELVFYFNVFIYIMYKIITLNHEYCNYHYRCYGVGGDDYLYSDISTYETYDGCSDSATISYDITEYEKTYHLDYLCEGSTYGCCKIHNRCQISHELNFTYNEYWDTYSSSFNSDSDSNGVIFTGIKKIDNDGSNCPTYNDIFTLRELNEMCKPLKIYTYLTFWAINYNILIICWAKCNKKKQEFQPVNNEECVLASV